MIAEKCRICPEGTDERPNEETADFDGAAAADTARTRQYLGT